MKLKGKCIQVSNIAPQATKDQMVSLFNYVGKVDEVRLYPTVRDVLIPVQSRICFIKFQDRDSVAIAQHLTNTIFIDRALTVIPFTGSEIPDEKASVDILHSNGAIPGLATDAKWPSYITNHIEGVVLRTDDPKLAENGLPDYPNLPATTEAYKVNEIRRTVVIDNINPKATAADVMALGESVGVVKYVKMGIVKDGTNNCLVEFSEMSYVIPAMKLHQTEFMGLTIIVNHATTAIAKPLSKSTEIVLAEIEDAMKRVKDVQTSLFNSNVDALAFLDVSAKEMISLSTSRSRSRSRRRTRSKSRSSRTRRRSRSKSPSSKTRRRSRSRSRKKSRSRSRVEHSSRSRRHRSGRRRSRSRSKRSRSRPRRSRSRAMVSHSRTRKSRSRSKTKRSRKTRSRSPSKTESSRKEKEVKPKTAEEIASSIDAIAELISKELQKESDASKEEEKVSKQEKEEKPAKESKPKKSSSRSRSRERHRRRSRSRGRVHRTRSRSKRSRSRSRRRRSKERRTIRRRHSRSLSKKRKPHRSRSTEKKERRKEKKSPELKKVTRNYDEEDEMYSEDKKAESADSKKEEAIDMDISD